MAHHGRTTRSVLDAPTQTFGVLTSDQHPDGPRHVRRAAAQNHRAAARYARRAGLRAGRVAALLAKPGPTVSEDSETRRAVRRAAAAVRRDEQRKARISAGTDRQTNRALKMAGVR